MGTETIVSPIPDRIDVTATPLRDRSAAWRVLIASAVVVCFGMGGLFCLGVFLKPIEDATGWSRTAISATISLNWLFAGLGSFVWGWLSNRYPAGIISVLGGSLLGLGFVLSSQTATVWQLYLTFGVLVGFACGAFYAPLVAVASRWFPANRGLAVATISAGLGLGTLVIATLARILIDFSDWRLAMLMLGDLSWLIIIPTALLIKTPPVGAVADGAIPRTSAGAPFSLSSILRTRQFWIISAAHLLCCTAHSGPIFHMVTHAIDQGIPALVAASILGVASFLSIPGRIVTGAIADRFGVKRTLVAGLVIQAVVILLFLFAHGIVSFYTIAITFGMAYGGVMPLYAVVIRDYFGERAMAPAYGAAFFASCIGMALGALLGGLSYDYMGSYVSMFVTAAGVGLAAVALAAAVGPLHEAAPSRA
jgi:MFS family permease